jgi:hypothetical protein|nr:MAG TPA: Thymidylate synthase complementing protein [Caudoviricetes sp.]
MIYLSNTITPSPEQWLAALSGARNAMNSWNRIDSDIREDASESPTDGVNHPMVFNLGKNDKKLLQNLCKAGSSHRKFLRMLPVTVDITAPVYFMRELDTYKTATVLNSSSFMHKGLSTSFVAPDFSMDPKIRQKIWKMQEGSSGLEQDMVYESIRECIEIGIADLWCNILKVLNVMREEYLKTKDEKIFQEIRNLLPSGYNVFATWFANYEVLLNIYHQRKDHRLPDWRNMCKWIEEMPYFKEICLGE